MKKLSRRTVVAIGKGLAAARAKKDLKQYEVAETVQIGETYYSNLERGTSSPSLPLLLHLCEVLQVKPGTLLDDCSPELRAISSDEQPNPKLSPAQLQLIEKIPFCDSELCEGILAMLAVIVKE